MCLIPNRRVVSHAFPMVGLLKGSPLRSPLDMASSFASEQAIDELAHTAKMDPIELPMRTRVTQAVPLRKAAVAPQSILANSCSTAREPDSVRATSSGAFP
jgi:CO/xanthine dehydrogenase Mo-binding subunit